MFETFSDSRVCVCVSTCAGHSWGRLFSFSRSTLLRGWEGMEAVRPFPESLAGGLAGLIPRRLWEPTGSGLPEQQPESERAEGRRLGHRSWSCRLRPGPTHPPGRRWSGGAGRCLPQRQTPPGVSCSSRPVPAGRPGVGAVRTPPGGYLSLECKGLGCLLSQTAVGGGSHCCFHFLTFTTVLTPCLTLECSISALHPQILSFSNNFGGS